MLSEYRPQSHQNYLALPIIGELLEDFIQWADKRGYTHGTIDIYLRYIKHIVEFLHHTKGVKSLEEITHADFEDVWQYFRDDHPSIASTARCLRSYIEEIKGLPPPPPRPTTRIENELREFCSFLLGARGFSGKTVSYHMIYLRRFLDFIGFEADEKALVMLRLEQIDAFIEVCSETSGRHSLQHIVAYLRNFLRFEYARKILHSPLHSMIDTPRTYQMEKLPHYLPWETVDAFLHSIDRTKSQGIRNYAMLLLITTYGLRSGEVKSLELDDIHWRQGEIQIRQPKNRHQLVLPLTDEVANALIDYLKNARPKIISRYFFLRVRAPHGVLKTNTAIANAFESGIRTSGMDIPYHGTHCLRHSYAVHLLRKGVSMKAIGDVLGHRSPDSTRVYLRLAIDDLRCVALDAPKCPEALTDMKIQLLKNVQLPRARKPYRKLNSSAPLQSIIAEQIAAYLHLHHSLGKRYRQEEDALHNLDYFMATECQWAKALDGTVFNSWCGTMGNLAYSSRLHLMRIVRNFCLFRQRTCPDVFVPDALTFPAVDSKPHPFIISQKQSALFLQASRYLPACTNSLRPETMRLALLLLFTTGLRRGELIRLTIADFNIVDSTLFIRNTKFHKERLIPLSVSVAAELRGFLESRRINGGKAMTPSSPIFWNNLRGPSGTAYTGSALRRSWRQLSITLGILTPKGIPARIHDIRHSFAVNALVRWYENGEDLMVKLPHLSTYMGHISISSTQLYLHFIEPLRIAASNRFEGKYGTIAVPAPKKS